MSVRVWAARSAEDVAKAYALDRMILPDDEPYAMGSARWWLASVDGQTVAYAGAKALQGANAGHVMLCRAGVLPCARGAGLQKRLIRARLRWAAGLERVGAVVTYTVRDNVRSSNSLIACGFRLYTPAAPWFAPDTDVLYWRKALT